MQNSKRMQLKPSLVSQRLFLAAAVVFLAACTVTPRKPAPVESRTVGKTIAPATAPKPAPVAAPVESAKPLPGAENAGKPGYYTVKPGDTLIRIALDNGQNWRDLVKWNALENPNLIETGQVLRVVAPSIDASAVSTRPVTASKVETRPLDAKPSASSPASTPAAVAAASASAGKDADEELSWGWPAAGPVINAYDELKGVSISGKAGDAVLAAAEGRVMYVGTGLRGYGNVIIIKHNANYLTAYAHNQSILVKDGQVVRKGQKIAEMGSSDADQVKLHFEVRKQGKLIDPIKLLPAR
jgi:lipoprotein NlpD